MRSGLSKNLRDALGRMASKKEAEMMSLELAERLELEQAEMVDRMEIDWDPEPNEEWSEGVEHLQEKTPAELYKMLGLERHAIPFFRSGQVTERDASQELGEQETSATTTEGHSLQWHQLVGVVKMLDRAKKSEPVLLMDDVGLGKTVQVIALFSMLAYYRTYFKLNGRYPGLWGESRAFIVCESRGS
jgi:SNF2 family DNA or RNA helicase